MEEPLSALIGENLTALRKSRHLTQQELAEKIGYSDKSISKWEMGKAIPKVEILKQFADYYDVSVDSLLSSGTGADKARQDKARINRVNKVVVTALAGVVVLFTALVIYVDALVREKNTNIWLVFVWMVPAIFLVCGFLVWRFWGRSVPLWTFASLLTWTFLIAVCLQFQVTLNESMWYILIIGLPVQLSLFLLARIRR